MKHVKPPLGASHRKRLLRSQLPYRPNGTFAVLGLAYQMDRAVELMEKLTATGPDRDRPELVPSMRRLVTALLDILDSIDPDPDLEPSLGSCDPSMWRSDQTSWGQGARDDRERDDDTGIGDQDGLDEQVPFRDWQMVGMV